MVLPLKQKSWSTSFKHTSSNGAYPRAHQHTGHQASQGRHLFLTWCWLMTLQNLWSANSTITTMDWTIMGHTPNGIYNQNAMKAQNPKEHMTELTGLKSAQAYLGCSAKHQKSTPPQTLTTKSTDWLKLWQQFLTNMSHYRDCHPTWNNGSPQSSNPNRWW